MAETYLDVEGDVNLKTWVPASQRLLWWNVGRWAAVLVVIALIITGLEFLLSGVSAISILAAEVAGGIVLVFLLLVFVVPRARRTRALNEGHMHFVARDDGYVIDGPFGTQTMRWSIYKKAYVDDRFIYLLMSARFAQVIPLELVPNPQPLLDHLRRLDLLRPTPKAFFLF